MVGAALAVGLLVVSGAADAKSVVVVSPRPVVVAPRPVVVAPRPVVVAPRPVVVAPRPVVVVPKAWSPAWVDYCRRKYVTFNPRTGYYVAAGGRAMFCR
jgi:hypothetical protein